MSMRSLQKRSPAPVLEAPSQLTVRSDLQSDYFADLCQISKVPGGHTINLFFGRVRELPGAGPPAATLEAMVGMTPDGAAQLHQQLGEVLDQIRAQMQQAPDQSAPS